MCNAEFYSEKLSQKYCSKECRLESVRERDRIRKRKERAKEREEREQRKEQFLQAKKEAREKEEREREAERERELFELKTKANEGDPKARMTLAKPFSVEYWEAYKDYEIENSLKYDNKPIRYVNGISVYDDNFTEKVMFTIEEEGRILSELVRV